MFCILKESSNTCSYKRHLEKQFFSSVCLISYFLYMTHVHVICVSLFILYFITWRTVLSSSLFMFISIKFHMFVIEINEELLKWYLIYQYTSHFKVIIINVHCFFPFNIIALNTGYLNRLKKNTSAAIIIILEGKK